MLKNFLSKILLLLYWVKIVNLTLEGVLTKAPPNPHTKLEEISLQVLWEITFCTQ